jgi:hypothetical protein
MMSAITRVAIIIVKFDVITGFSKPEKPDIISINHHSKYSMSKKIVSVGETS